jgi:protein gp37
MPQSTSIEWTDTTWNPVTGCSKISPGCANCYAERLAARLQAMGSPHYRSGFRVAWHQDALDAPLHWQKPRRVFVNSMSDLFHEDVPFEFVERVFDVMRLAEQHQFQVLTKRSELLARYAPRLIWPPNVWMGVSVESSSYTYRIDQLRHVGAAIRFLSLEPLLGPVADLDLTRIDWVIVGGESGPGARPMEGDWVLDIRDQCVAVGVPFFFKQWGGVRRKEAGRLLEGRSWDQYPAVLPV